MPPTVHPPLTSITPTNQTGIIAILAGFTLGILILCLLLRLYTRRSTSRKQSDDAVFYLSLLFGTSNVILTLWLVSLGLGSSAAAHEGRVERGVVGATVLYLFCLAASKASCGLMFVWLTPFRGQRVGAWGVVCGSVVWGVSAGVVVATGCRDVAGVCEGARGRWVYIASGDMGIEAALVGASVYMVWGRSMSLRAKGKVVGAFACRVPNVGLTLAHLLFILLPAPTVAIHIARVQATTQLSISYTLVSCVIPYLRPLMQSYESDGPDNGRGRADATFNLSDRSRGSKGSRDLINAKELKALDKGKAKVLGSVGPELNDVSRLMGPERPGFVRLKSAEGVERVGMQVV